MNIDLGRVTPIYRGIYAAGASYELNDIVLYSNGCLYWHTKPEATTGVAPTDTAAWTLAFSGDDVEAAIEQIKEDAEAIAFGTRGGLPVGSSDPYYHNNAAWYASQASASATDANAAKVAAQGAQGAAETARDKSAQWATGGSSGTPGATNNSKYYSEQAAGSAAAAAGSAQDAEAWAAGTKAGVPVTGDDPQYENNAKYWSDEAAASAATFVTDPTLSVSGKAADAAAVGAFNQYILLREEEDRQILFGSVVEAAEDTYDELRSSPIHNAITIGQSVYPRMDRTRMAIDAIKGRTVAFNQLVPIPGSSISKTQNNVTFVDNRDGSCTISTTAEGASANTTLSLYPSGNVPVKANHVYFKACYKLISGVSVYDSYSAWNISNDNVCTIRKKSNDSASNCDIVVQSGTIITTPITIAPFFIDLTAMYGSTTAEAILAMETATAGAGVAYVRQRLDLDYYAPNAGELVAPVVSGVSVTGFNAWDEVTEVGGISSSTGENTTASNTLRTKNFIPVIPNSTYFINSKTAWQYMVGYGANKEFVGTVPYRTADVGYFLDIPANVHFARFPLMAAYGLAYKHDLCVNLSKATGSPKNGDYLPYVSTTLSIPSTRLDGVGTARDTLYVREDGENDYALIKRSVMINVDLGTLAWTAQSLSGNRTAFKTPNNRLPAYPRFSTSEMPNAISPVAVATYQNAPSWGTNVFVFVETSVTITGGNLVFIFDDGTYADAAAFKSAMDGKSLCYEKYVPTETVLASHLTLAEVSAIAENGGIISIANSNGHIVQPDLTCDVVISRSAS